MSVFYNILSILQEEAEKGHQTRSSFSFFSHLLFAEFFQSCEEYYFQRSFHWLQKGRMETMFYAH